MREDSNPRSPQGDAGFQDRDLKPLRHSSQPFLHKTHRCSLLVLSALVLSQHKQRSTSSSWQSQGSFAPFMVFFCIWTFSLFLILSFFYEIKKRQDQKKRSWKRKQRKHQKVFLFWRRPGSNRSLHACKACVLPTKLRPRINDNLFAPSPPPL